MTLHCLYSAPSGDPASRCLAALATGDAVLLLAAATTLARPGHPALSRWINAGARLYALDEDLAAHGVDAPAATVTVISYGGWVDLSLQQERQQVWS